MEDIPKRFETDGPTPEQMIEEMKRQIFAKLSAELKNGQLYPERKDSRAEYLKIVSSMKENWFTVSVAEEEVNEPKEIRGKSHFPYLSPGRSIEYWFYPTSILVQHLDNFAKPGDWGDYRPIDEKQEITLEELVNLHKQIVLTPIEPE